MERGCVDRAVPHRPIVQATSAPEPEFDHVQMDSVAAVFTWLGLVFVNDLGMMAGTLAWRIRVQNLVGLALCNPCQVFKMWSLYTDENQPTP